MKMNEEVLANAIFTRYAVALKSETFDEVLKNWGYVEAALDAMWNLVNYADGSDKMLKTIEFLRGTAKAHMDIALHNPSVK